MATVRLTVEQLQLNVGVNDDGIFGPASRAALNNKLTNRRAPAATDKDYAAIAARLDVPVQYMRGVRKIEAPRGSFDDQGRPTNLFERHKFAANTVPSGRFNASHSDISGPPYGRGGYGPFSAQYDRFYEACALDPEAAFRACSWGAFQVMGENAAGMKYPSTYDMVVSLTTGEAAHLETFARFIEMKGLQDELRACRPGDPKSCIPFVRAYNGAGYAEFGYHTKFAAAIAG